MLSIEGHISWALVVTIYFTVCYHVHDLLLGQRRQKINHSATTLWKPVLVDRIGVPITLSKNIAAHLN
jgi:hypothetical protein